MAFNPLLMAGLLPAVATAAGNQQYLKRSALEKRQEEKLQDLLRQEEMGLLGLSDKEKSAMAGRLRAGGDAAAKAAAAEQSRLMAGLGGSQAGMALEQAALMNEQRMRQEQAVEQSVLEADLAEEEREREEMRALEAAQAQISANRQAARGQIAEAAIESVAGTVMQNQLMQGGAVKPSSQTLAYLKTRGLNDEQAAGFMQMMTANPEMIKYLDRLED